MILKFPPFMPDLPNYDNPGTIVATNVIPQGISYKQFPDLTPYASALAEFAQGAISTRDPQFGTSFNFVGTASKIYLLGKTTPGVYDDVSKAGGYTTGADENWYFTEFGARVLATNFDDPIQSYKMGTSTLFEDLSTDAPNARYITTVRDFVMVGNTNDGTDGFVPNRVRWCGIGDATKWVVSSVTMADFQDLDSSYGWITQVVGGNYGLVFQEKAITRMDFVGSPVVFDFNTIERSNGTKYPGSVRPFGTLTFYIGIDGFYVFDGSLSTPIGVDQVDKFFFNDLDTNHDFKISSAIDYTNHLVMWAYPGAGNVNGNPNKILIYNYSPNSKMKWALIDLTQSANVSTGIEYLYSAISEGYSLDGIDQWQVDNQNPPVTSLGAANIDILPYSLDSKIWNGKNVIFGAFTANHELAFASSNTWLPAVIETAETQLNAGQRTDLYRVKAYVEGNAATPSATSVTVQIGSRNLFTDSVSYSAAVPPDANGEIQCLINARYHRMRVNISGGFSNAVGVEILEQSPGGYF